MVVPLDARNKRNVLYKYRFHIELLLEYETFYHSLFSTEHLSILNSEA